MSLALAAILISGFTLAWTVGWSIYTHRRATRPRITVRASWGYPVYDLPGGGRHLGDTTITLTATNTGQAAVTLSGCKLLIRGEPSGSSVVPVDWVAQAPSSLPIRLEPGDHWTGMIHAASVRQSLDHHRGPREHWRVRPVVSDTADRRYRAKIGKAGWRRLLPARWMKLEPGD